MQPSLDGFPEELLAQPFYGWGFVGKKPISALQRAYPRRALASVVVVLGNSFKALNSSSLFVISEYARLDIAKASWEKPAEAG